MLRLPSTLAGKRPQPPARSWQQSSIRSQVRRQGCQAAPYETHVLGERASISGDIDRVIDVIWSVLSGLALEGGFLLLGGAGGRHGALVGSWEGREGRRWLRQAERRASEAAGPS